MNENNLINEFLYFAENAWGKNPKTIKAYRICLEEMQEYLFENKEVTSEMLSNTYADILLLQWLRVKEKEGLKASSLNQRLAAVRSLLTWLCGRGDLTVNFAKMIPQFKNTTHETKETLNVEESWKLLDIASEIVSKDENYNTLRDLLICQLFIGCGLRIDEVSNLDIDCFNLDENKLYLTKTKFNKFRKVSIPQEVIETFKKYMSYRVDLNSKLDESIQGALFISKKRLVLSTEQIRKDLYRLLNLCEFDKKITPHSLRHSFATLMLSSGDVTIEQVAQEMGHSNISTIVNYYLHQDSKDISVSNPVFNRNKKVEKETKKPTISKEENSNLIQIKFNVG